MQFLETPVPHLTTVHSGPLHHIEEVILNQLANIEAWFRQRWQETPAPITSSVDLRHAGFKLSPVDTNLFPAGFNNLNRDFLPLCIQAAQAVIGEQVPSCTKILLLPESHTRNQFYFESLSVLRDIFAKAGFIVRIGSLNSDLTEPVKVFTQSGHVLLLEPVQRKGNKLGLVDFEPCLLLLNNDLSSGLPDVLQGIEQDIQPTAKLGWASRLKSDHFTHFSAVAAEFAHLVNMDPWLLTPLFSAVDGIDFMAQAGVEALAEAADKLLLQIREKYKTYGITEKPFLAVKADNGTYGMSVMMIHDAQELLQLNRKQRTRMASSKGSQKVSKVIIQEGVYTFETMPNGAVAEPVVYMIGQFVVGGFYRVHQGRGKAENLNAPGMQFEPLAFAQACNMPRKDLSVVECPNRFYVYGVLARLAALAAAREIAAINR
ncbi:glutamate--cysteine ligase [Legionella septentrionalis]|uniref:Glutamate--cysteine ligase n=1 Tax=Legionella septentrionalis TaxID=2498109 RepID=A0A433JMC4_9GAMM|nr:glutamate--cysteine ligase [Legionella septentrionalis]RUQ91540.1 glutamate--cysteine ligase [Legionella septentrionalis]RUQ94986.1 glutamate--cysteine ligase [Legionella septentrionalis]RUR10590.1 glutamate--cysteine ligase [Legionella septentrionalis]